MKKKTYSEELLEELLDKGQADRITKRLAGRRSWPREKAVEKIKKRNAVTLRFNSNTISSCGKVFEKEHYQQQF